MRGWRMATLPCPVAAALPDEGESGEGDEAGAIVLAWQRGDQIETPGVRVATMKRAPSAA